MQGAALLSILISTSRQEGSRSRSVGRGSQAYEVPRNCSGMPPELEEYEDFFLTESSLSGTSKDSLKIVDWSACNRRRAMVNKLWCNDLARRWFQTRVEPPHGRVFSEPKCQCHVSMWYLIYRWIILSLWSTIIICSIFELGSSNPMGNQFKWLIYLTNWDLVLGTTQALLGALIVTRRWRFQRNDSFDANNLKLGTIERAYWYFYVVTCTLAIGVTATYWCAVYDPKMHQLDPLNIMLHVFNSVLMVADFCVVSAPFKIRSIWWILPVVSVYVIFTVIYYLAGGLDKLGLHYIYKILDWEKPGRTILICLGCMIFVSLVHLLLCGLERLKIRCYRKINANQKHLHPELEINPTDMKKRSEIV